MEFIAWQKSLLPVLVPPSSDRDRESPPFPLLDLLPVRNSRIQHAQKLFLQKNWVRKPPPILGSCTAPQTLNFHSKLNLGQNFAAGSHGSAADTGCALQLRVQLWAGRRSSPWILGQHPTALGAGPAELGAGLPVTHCLWELIPPWNSSALCLCCV